jgi:formylglycine-generating enzyme required for sulfatase activity
MRHIPLAAGLSSALFATVPWAVAQNEAELKLQTYAGLTVTGEIGKVYSIEYVTDLTDPIKSDKRCLEYLQLPASPYLWVDKSALATGKRFYRAVAMEPPENMAFIPPGTFRMGSPEDEVDRDDNEGPQTDVIISRGFWMGRYEVTQGEYLAVMGNNPSWFNGVRQVWDPESQTEIDVDYGTDLTRPVETVSWEDAVAYCAALTEQERLAARIPANCVYRLPTEAEWEYACRAWTSTRFSYGDDPGYTNLTNYAWYWDNSGRTTHPVGQKLPNTWGLHDMHGNVMEWCQHWWGWPGNYSGGIVLDPQVGVADQEPYVLRGGGSDGWVGWNEFARNCRSASRYKYWTEDRSISYFGFRVVLAPVLVARNPFPEGDQEDSHPTSQ